ncbi:YqcC family protein [Photobacterium damselae]|uniref:YqcC family protein n=1 Tax=Photobacterium damselae TaxID=38293 RepID=UPI001EDDD6C4|nr:YqcC family protein [Photobacterium damselae]MCG3846711.1 YqcC family protein [Photobacterium damselae]
MNRYHQTAELLNALEAVLREHNHWQPQSPDAQALASTLPFAVDTLSCSQWLQWIFIPKFNQLILEQWPLPTGFEISPYIEEAMKSEPGQSELLTITRQIEQILGS